MAELRSLDEWGYNEWGILKMDDGGLNSNFQAVLHWVDGSWQAPLASCQPRRSQHPAIAVKTP